MNTYACWVTLRNGLLIRVELASIGRACACVAACRLHGGLSATAKVIA
jgi:hypothetical protein